MNLQRNNAGLVMVEGNNIVRDSAEAAVGRRVSPWLSVTSLSVLFLLTLWSALVWYLNSERDERLEFATRVTERMTESVEAQVRIRFRSAEVFLSMVQDWVGRNPGLDVRDDPQFSVMLQQIGVVEGNLVDLRVIDNQGKMDWLTLPSASPANAAESGYFLEARVAEPHQLVIGRPVFCAVRTRWVLPVAMSLPANSAELAVVMLAVDLEDLVADFDRQRLTRNSGVALIRRDGVMLARAPFVEGYLGVSVAGNRLFREYLPQAPTAVRRFRTDATDNVERIVGYSQLQDYPLIVVVASSVDDVLVDWRQKRNGLLWAAAMLSLLSLGVTLHLSRLLAALDRRQDDLEHLATVDTMTGALNRAAFFAALSRESDRAARYGTPLTAMMFDLDFFKRINDAYGHAVGDEALKLFAAAVASELRNVDAFGRIGGEEFVALLPNTAVGAAQQLAERLREKVALIRIESEAHDAVRFTVSVGVAELAREGDWVEGGDAMLKRADEALYEAKKSGRNRVLTSQPKPRRRDETGRN